MPTSSEVCQPEECVPTSSELCQPEEDVGGQALEPDDEPAPQPPAEEELPATGLGILPIVATGAGIATAGVGVTIFARRRRT